ncbi:PREDICTED: LOW QUALITY PROTEIN: protein sidekick-2, partial [Tinamus guttatus]|uniref:LOW QUALITY PROTEIN: protein sidekick-2 n=1 Tax=Tinamus guttatus TaxID=94827 RepID=UPI00052E8FB5
MPARSAVPPADVQLLLDHRSRPALSSSLPSLPADDVSPYFKTEPVRSQVHLEGNRLVLTCMAEGSWPLEFKWLHNSRELTKFSLEYRSSRCSFRNRMGALLQRQTEVQVAYMGSFEEGKGQQRVSQGDAAVVPAPRIASFPRPQVTWSRRIPASPARRFAAITLDNTLVILSTVAPDAGRYYVQAVNDKNGDNKTSQPITLAVASELRISGLLPHDTGMFQCFARNAAGEVQATTYLAVTSIAPNITKGPQDSTVIDGMSVVLNCETSGAPRPAIAWQKGERILASGSVQLPRFTLLESGSLLVSPAHLDDAGTYSCLATNSRGVDEASADLVVWAPPPDGHVPLPRSRQLPHAPESPVAALSPLEKRAINLTWAKPFDGNSPLLRYVVEVSENNAPWTVLLASVDPALTSVAVRGLVPARSYQFRLCAVNDVGRGQFSKDTERVSLPEEPPSAPPQNVIASGRTNQSIMIQWQPPPESHQNGVLKGYVIRYCLAGLPVGYQFKNITSAEVNNLLLEDLIIWTNYEIEVAAYNSAGLGVYSMKVTEWTLQGVPTVPPGNVQAEATNSTTIRFTWTPPSPQFINGINQGYKVRVPGPVGHLSFGDILDTSLRVSWREPPEKNGVLTGYRISWEEYNRTNTRVTHYLPNVTLEYRVTGLTALTTYTIEVAAMTSKGQGQLSSSTISSGVPPELPGAPTNLGISNICPRSPLPEQEYNGNPDSVGYRIRYARADGRGRPLSRELPDGAWAVRAAGPNASAFLVDRLKPFTSYKFRVKATNDIGDSDYSEESESLTTLQAAPEEAPTILSVTPHTTTSVLIRWQVPSPRPLCEGSGALRNLSKHRRYEIRLSVYNAAGEGPPSAPQEVFVGEAVPTAAPQNVAVQAVTATQLDVTWDPPPPESQNGDIQGYKGGYRLVYEPCSPVDGVSKIVTVDVKGSSPLWMKVKDLAEGVTYRFRIRAKTFAYGPDIEANVTTGPGEVPDEGLWDILIKDIPKEVTSYTFSMDILKQGVSYDFRVIAVNDYGYGTPSTRVRPEPPRPPPLCPAQKANPFYEEWWFLVVIALVGLIFILLLVFVLIIRGQSKKYAKKSDSGNGAKANALGHGEMLSLDESSFPALELNNRRLSVKNSFCRKNGIYTRSPPRPSPAKKSSLPYSDEDVPKYNALIPAESSSLTEKPSEVSDSQGSDSEYEVDAGPQKGH